VTGQVMGYTTTLALSQGSGAVVAAAQTAMPMVLAGGSVIIVAAIYMSHAERVKAENEIADAIVYAFTHNANDEDVGRYYREQCESIIERVSHLRMVLDKAASDPQGLEDLASQFGDIDA